MTCPKCGEARAHRSHRSGLKDRVYRLFRMTPYRCRACERRFYAYLAGEKSDRMRTREEQKIMRLRRRIKWRRSRRELLAFGSATAILVLVIYYLIQQRVVSD
jgi:uncharacterized membrane protein